MLRAAATRAVSGGYGSSGSQVSLAMLKSMGRLDVLDVPYKGIPQAITDTMGGSLAFTFVDLGNALAQAKAEEAKPPGLLKLLSTFFKKDFRRGLAVMNDLLVTFGRNLSSTSGSSRADRCIASRIVLIRQPASKSGSAGAPSTMARRKSRTITSVDSL